MRGPAEWSGEDVMTTALDMFDAVAASSRPEDARQAVRAIASDLTADQLRRVTSALACTSVGLLRRSQGRARVQTTLRDLRFRVQVAGLADEVQR